VPAPLEPVYRLEERLSGTEPIGFFFRVHGGGRLTAELTGNVELLPLGEAKVDLEGELGSLPARLVSSEDGRQLTVESGSRNLVMHAPESFRALLATGIVRVGVVDTIVRLLGGTLPHDPAALRRDTKLRPIANVDAEPSREDLADCTGHAFTVHQDRGFEIATATLWIERATGLPRERAHSMRLLEASSTEQYWGF
jgi:hypothetical protein